jgi:formylglycine-generating enzyme required for sulfatase activity
MKRVLAASYDMGSVEQDISETPVHRVSVASFEMDITEVTVSAYRTCVQAEKCTAPGTKNGCNYAIEGRDDHPINCVDWPQANAYCAAQGKRLPSEEEWELAARGTDRRRYPWGNETPRSQLCWGRRSTCPVGSFPDATSPFGLLDMAGNVWEWTSSHHSESYASERTSTAIVTRGGAWLLDAPAFVRTAIRGPFAPSMRSDQIGWSFSDSKVARRFVA